MSLSFKGKILPVQKPPSKIHYTIQSFVIAQALLKLTSDTVYPTVLEYCLHQTAKLQNLRIIIADNQTIHKNNQFDSQESNYTPESNFSLDSDPDSACKNDRYFSCSINQFQHACLSSKKAIDHTEKLDDIQNVIHKLIQKGWLLCAEIKDADGIFECSAQQSYSYRVNLTGLQQALQNIGCELIIIQNGGTVDNLDNAANLDTATIQANNQGNKI